MEAISNNHSDSSVANVAIDGEASPEHWYVAQVRMKCEKKTAARISDMGFETFVPVIEEIHQWSDRKKKIEKVLIPLIVFFKADSSGAKAVEKLPAVFSLLKPPGAKDAAIIPDWQMSQFKFMTGNCDGEISVEQNVFAKGDRVKVVRGNLKGLEGFVRNESEDKIRLYIILERFGCASVLIPITDIIKIDK